MTAAVETVAPRPAATRWLVGALLALQPLATDMYLPTLPSIATAFDASVATVQWTLSGFIATFAVIQLVAGPLSDRFGRYPVIVGGTGLYCLGTLLCALAPTIGILIGGRVMQGAGACASIVCARAIVRDLHAPSEGARLLAAAGTIMGLAPLLGPLVCSVLLAFFGWRAPFAALAGFAFALAVALALRLKETNRFKNAAALDPRELGAAWRAVLGNPTFYAYTLANATSYMGLFAFLSGSSFVLIKVMGLSATEYAIGFALTVSGYMVGTLVCRRLMPRLGLARSLEAGAMLQAVAGATVLALALAGVAHPAAVLVPQFFFVVSHGMLQPVAQAGAVALFPRTAGTAAAWMGFIVQTSAALVGLALGATWNGTIFPMAIVICAAGAGSLLVALALVRRHGHVG